MRLWNLSHRRPTKAKASVHPRSLARAFAVLTREGRGYRGREKGEGRRERGERGKEKGEGEGRKGGKGEKGEGEGGDRKEKKGEGER